GRRLHDPPGSSINRQVPGRVSGEDPGPALTDTKQVGQIAPPRIDSKPSDEDLGEVVAKTCRAISGAWRGPVAPPVRVLPYQLPAATLPGPEETRLVPIGVDERGFEPVLLDLFDRDQNLLVLGDGECGKTNLLRLVAEGLMARYAPGEIVFAVMDPRRTLRDAIPEPYLGGYASNPRVCAGLSGGVAKELEGRMPDDADPDTLENQGPVGPRSIVLVDDYDLLPTAGQNALTPFAPFVRQ